MALNVNLNVTLNEALNVSLNMTLIPTMSELWYWQPIDTIGKCDTQYNSQCGSQYDSQGESQCDSQTNLVRALVLVTNIYN